VLSPDTATVSLWLDEPYRARAALEGDTTCEVCVIGAGIGGLSAAWRLAGLGVEFTQAPAELGPVTTAVFDDTCGNLIQIAHRR
jgi:predicted NAD/FAD-binding protein